VISKESAWATLLGEAQAQSLLLSRGEAEKTPQMSAVVEQGGRWAGTSEMVL